MSPRVKRLAAVTGLGAVSPFGLGANVLWNALLEGRDAVRAHDVELRHGRMSRIPMASVPLTSAELQEVLGQQISVGFGELSRTTLMSLIATHEALSDAGLLDASSGAVPDTISPVGVCLGTALSSMAQGEEGALRWTTGRRLRPSYISAGIPSTLSAEISIAFRLNGPFSCISTACASGASAIGQGLRLIQLGEAEVVVCGAADAAMTPAMLSSFSAAGVIAELAGVDGRESVRPFSARRTGTAPAEGAATLILESIEHASSRNARPYAVLGGFATTCDAYHHIRVDPDGSGLARAITAAANDAEIPLSSVAYVSAHGTGTLLNDMAETRALRSAFSRTADRLPVTGLKGSIGHASGASPAIAAAATVLALKHRLAPPTLNGAGVDPDCDLDYVRDGPRKIEGRYGLVLASGFGGVNAALIFGRSASETSR